tara:strand:- start:159 stop:719 length:561 start_codon:yes stop_codon:yes gene_type:complete
VAGNKFSGSFSKGKTVQVFGVKETLKDLAAFDKAAVRAFNKVITSEVGKATLLAQSEIPDTPPMSGWREVAAINGTVRGGAGWPAWSTQRARAGIKHTRAGGKVHRNYTSNYAGVVQNDAAGAIYEVAGRRRPNANQFIRNLSRDKRASRAIWRAVDRLGPEIRQAFAREFDKVQKELQRHLKEKK